MCKRDNSHFIHCVVISPEAEIVLIFVRSITFIPLDIFWKFLVGMTSKTSRCVACKRVNSHCLRYIVISPEAEILCRP